MYCYLEIKTFLSSCFQNFGKCLLSSCFRDNIHNEATDDTQQPLLNAEMYVHYMTFILVLYNSFHSDDEDDNDLTYEQLKKEGVTDSSAKCHTKDKIETFFHGEYNDIVEHQIAASNEDDFQVDEVLTKHMKVTKHFIYSQIMNIIYMYLPYAMMVLALKN